MMKLPIEFIKDAKMKADFSAFLNATTDEEREHIISEYNAWFTGLSVAEKAIVTASRTDSMRRFLAAAHKNLEQMDGWIPVRKPIDPSGQPAFFSNI